MEKMKKLTILVTAAVLLTFPAPVMAFDSFGKSIVDIYGTNQSIYERDQVTSNKETQKETAWEMEKQTFEMQQERQQKRQEEYDRRDRKSSKDLRNRYNDMNFEE